MSDFDALRFAAGSVGTGDYDERFCHALITGGRLTTHDGVLSLSTPIGINIDAKPHFKTLVHAVKACGKDESSRSLHLTPGNKLSIKNGKFKAFVDCLPPERDMSSPQPSGVPVELSPALMDGIKELAPFIASPEERLWSTGLRISGTSIFATNNVVLLEKHIGQNFPFEVIIPRVCVEQLIRLDQNPLGCRVDHYSITFYYENKRWLRSQLIDDRWPLSVAGLLDAECNGSPVVEGVFDAIDTLKPFFVKGASTEAGTANKIYFLNDAIATSNIEGVGATIEVLGVKGGPIFAADKFRLLKNVATQLDLSTWPKKPCPFRGNKIRGVIVGMTR